MNVRIIALIEDDINISTMYQIKFESEGFEVNVATNGRIGVEMVTQKLPHIILLDISMPEMDGAEALKLIRKLPGGQKIPVVILTNLGQQEAPQALQHLGIAEYIIKANSTPRQVVERVKCILSEIED